MMRTNKLSQWIGALSFGLFGMTAMSSAWAHGRVHLDLSIGPYWNPAPYYHHHYLYRPIVPVPIVYPPYVYSPPIVIERSAPPIYIEQTPAVIPTPTPAPAPAPMASPPPETFWYYCATAQGYYPYVKTCPSGWQKVAPRPPGQS